jgi:hypothetical protein
LGLPWYDALHRAHLNTSAIADAESGDHVCHAAPP